MPKRQFYRNQAETIIKKLQLRKMEGYYCENREEAKAKFMELVGTEPKSISYGGSVTIDELGLKEALEAAGHDLVRRENFPNTPEGVKECKARQATSDIFMTSTNAITLDGELVNIDGAGSRVWLMTYGPDEVIIVAGMNKVVTDVEEGIARTHNFAAPPNTVRLNKDTPCAKTGKCGNCLNDTICCTTVVTRASRVPGRTKVILVGEELGF